MRSRGPLPAEPSVSTHSSFARSDSLDELLAMDAGLLLQPLDLDMVRMTDDVESGSSLDGELSWFNNEMGQCGDLLTDNTALDNPSCFGFPAMNGGYASTNSSDSGKHSPSSSEGVSDHSPWMHSSEPSTSNVPQQCSPLAADHYNYSHMGQTETPDYCAFVPGHDQEKVFYSPRPAARVIDNSPPIVQTANNTGVFDYNASTVTSEGVQQVSRQPSKIIYVLPNPGTNVTNAAPILVKDVKSEGPKPMFINRVTGSELLPISVLPAPSNVVRAVPVANQQIQYRDKDDLDFHKKQEDRRMKNRASAQASRVRKKNELDEMKSIVRSLEQKNQQLVAENEQLKKRLAQYEGVNAMLSSNNSWAPLRKRAAVAGVCTMALCLMVAVAPIRDRTIVPTARHVTSTHSHNPGRVLSAEMKTAQETDNALSNITVGCGGTKKSWLNKTETIQLNNDLYNWVSRHEAMKGAKSGKRLLLHSGRDWPPGLAKEKVIIPDFKTNRTVAEKREEAKERAMRDRAWRHLDMISQAGDTLREKRDRARKQDRLDRHLKTTVFTKKNLPTNQEYERLVAAIQQKPDTLYIVPLIDYFLLPALERNSTKRPRVALVLPALSLNGTVTDQVSMMRIEVDVIGTSLFNLSRTLMPLFYY